MMFLANNPHGLFLMVPGEFLTAAGSTRVTSKKDVALAASAS